MYRALRPLQRAPERSESVPERSGAIYPDTRPALGKEGEEAEDKDEEEELSRS